MQRRIVGAGSLARLPEMTRGCAKEGAVVVVTGARPVDAYGGQATIEALPGSAIVLRSSGDLPRLEELTRLRRALGPIRPGCIVALGGGRIIDLAKLLASEPQCSMSVDEAVAAGVPVRRTAGLIAVPTTAGSGSESTPFAVCYVAGRKASIDHPSLLPDVAIVDPLTLLTLPPPTLASAGLDALCHSVEALLSRKATPESDRRAFRALHLAAQALPAASRAASAKGRLARAASEAGRAIAITRTTIPHALSYPLSQRHGIAHGHAVALSMGGYLERFGAALARDETLARWRLPYRRVVAALGCDAATVRVRWSLLVSSLGLPATTAQCGLSRADVARLRTEFDPARFANSPLALAPEDIPELFE